MKIAAGLCEYGDTDGLYRCLTTLGLDDAKGIDKVIIIHGRFDNFNLRIDPQAALEDTKKVISRFPKDRIDLVKSNGGLTEIASRNLYLKRATELKCDWLLVIDSDEYLAQKLTDWKKFRKQLQYVMDLGLDHHIFDIQLDGNIPAFHGPQPRLFYRPHTIQYWGTHYWWVIEESKRILKGQSDAARIIEGIHLLHDHTIRDSKYYTASINYKEWQQKHEGEQVITEDKKPEFESQMEKLKLKLMQKKQATEI
jgi:hypothetical protein